LIAIGLLLGWLSARLLRHYCQHYWVIIIFIDGYSASAIFAIITPLATLFRLLQLVLPLPLLISHAIFIIAMLAYAIIFDIASHSFDTDNIFTLLLITIGHYFLIRHYAGFIDYLMPT
jgi:hypothetical protein